MEIALKTDSRKVKPGDTFIAIVGVERDGHDYVGKALENGAVKVIVEHGSYPVETVVVEDTREYFKEYLTENYYPLISKMKLVGITGTNGKTSIGYMSYEMMMAQGKKVGYIGTIGFYVNGKSRPLNNTTPDLDVLYSLLLECSSQDCEAVIMEVSSHAIAYGRIHGLEFDVVAFTNLTQDHLDFHKTMENYLATKLELFKLTRAGKVAIINGDDPHGRDFVLEGNHNIQIKENGGDVNIDNYLIEHNQTQLGFTYQNKSYQTTIDLIGKYNIYNYLTSLMIVVALDCDIDSVLAENGNLQAPEGRMSYLKMGTNTVFIDYAHTPDAIENVCKTVRETTARRVFTVVGCGGNRDKRKRPLMAKVACDYSDQVVFTNDNPRNEEPSEIIADMIEGLESDNYIVIEDRREAIRRGIDLLEDNDVLLVLGKGHENYQLIRNKKFHFSDYEEVEEYIKEKNSENH